MTCGIYLVENQINGKVYIGQSVNIERRWGVEKSRKDTRYFSLAIQKYGGHNFKLTILLECPRERLNYYEIACIAEYGALGEDGYNLTDGGSLRTNYIVTEATREKLRQHNLGKKASEETRKRISEVLRQRKPKARPKPNKETKQRMSEAQRERWRIRKLQST